MVELPGFSRDRVMQIVSACSRVDVERERGYDDSATKGEREAQVCVHKEEDQNSLAELLELQRSFILAPLLPSLQLALQPTEVPHERDPVADVAVAEPLHLGVVLARLHERDRTASRGDAFRETEREGRREVGGGWEDDEVL